MLAVITLGEGWHNNHHRYPGSARQGFYGWELDLAYGGNSFDGLGLGGYSRCQNGADQHLVAGRKPQ
ncbi:MAG: hypothetical protein CM1200mP41_38430 [Gammaproteobacteria bacterium]|nr:MAG: hypothetical protein CM1200mP41_38430 [Gammaproteobacteria bacterium]